MNSYLDQRRAELRPVELRAEAANDHLARSVMVPVTARLARQLRALAARLDRMQGRGTESGVVLEELCQAVPSFR